MNIPTVPDPGTWLDSEKREKLTQIFGQCASFLRQAGLLRACLGYWVRTELAAQITESELTGSFNADSAENTWLLSNSLEDANMTRAELRSKLKVPQAVRIWSRKEWGHLTDSLYLSEKQNLDKASCSYLFLEDKDHAIEIYHQLKASEITFREAIARYADPGAPKSAAITGLMRLTEFPHKLGDVLGKLQPGDLSRPLRIGHSFCIVKLDKKVSSALDEHTEDILLAELLRQWVDCVVDEACTLF